ncbi:hypothetical protein K449DRAFT_271295 [Hypoxylon sp. EC38]|nr:hypothetical protein K449DRAFT_271295 [Hypoxylon sp. EC38]
MIPRSSLRMGRNIRTFFMPSFEVIPTCILILMFTGFRGCFRSVSVSSLQSPYSTV